MKGLIRLPTTEGTLVLIWPPHRPVPAACYLGNQPVPLQEATRLLAAACPAGADLNQPEETMIVRKWELGPDLFLLADDTGIRVDADPPPPGYEAALREAESWRAAVYPGANDRPGWPPPLRARAWEALRRAGYPLPSEELVVEFLHDWVTQKDEPSGRWPEEFAVMFRNSRLIP